MTRRTVLVTGANKGIGFEIARGLARLPYYQVIATARNEEAGLAAVKRLRVSGQPIHFHQLDITDGCSIKCCLEYLHMEFPEGIDGVVNNAGMAYKRAATEPMDEQAENTVAVNFFGTYNFSIAVLPLIKKSGRMVNVASQAGLVKQLESYDLRNRFLAPNLSENELCDLMKEFVRYESRDYSSTYFVTILVKRKLEPTRPTVGQIVRMESRR
eukprot:TRINITY_DN12571_c0_g1_i4.p1 TRINITY_DN12571_c0_g1~~TRINITY_DN12571_c0_g1_i4.p1  ORF type:complete len:213 (-),score=13.94 TRINITY_DN12571_c0_g1_i4:331-969(-)